MYLTHFNLKCHPFGLTPDTEFFFELRSQIQALNTLIVALQSGEGFIKITGDVGTGKTMLCRKLLNDLPDSFITAYIPSPDLSSAGLRLAIADELGISYPDNVSQSRLLNLLQRHLIEVAATGKRLVLIIDEAQAMSLPTLETLRLLTNLETEQQKLMQIVLFGQNELNLHLNFPAIRQLKQRITFSHGLLKLTLADIRNYLNHRLQIAGAKQSNIFTTSSLLALKYFSRGIPRLVNILANKAMLAAYGKGKQTIGISQIIAAAIDTEDVFKSNSKLAAKMIFYFFGLIATFATYFLISA